MKEIFDNIAAALTLNEFYFHEIKIYAGKAAAVFILTASLVSFIMCGFDKFCAIHGKRRISEKALLLSAVFFGSAGLLAGMYIFRHKTKKLKFTISVPLLLAFQLLLIFLCFKFVI